MAKARIFPLPRVEATNEFLNDRRLYEVQEDYHFWCPGIAEIVLIPKGFKTDLASTPRCLWWFINHDEQGFLSAAVIHDFLYRTQYVSRELADVMFLYVSYSEGAKKYKAIPAYLGLRMFGARNYKSDGHTDVKVKEMVGSGDYKPGA